MRRDESEEYDEEARDVIDGLRQLARGVETPSDLAPTILARGAQLLPSQANRRGRCWTIIVGWRPHPLAWGPVVAAAFFVAGLLVPWPHAGQPLQDMVSERSPAPAVQWQPQEAGEVSPATSGMTSQRREQEMRQQADLDTASTEPRRRLARHAPHQVAASAQMKVTASLPAEIYEQLRQEAERRRVSVTVILREAAEAYVQSPQRVE